MNISNKNCLRVSKILIKKLDLKITQSSIEERLFQHQNYPSLLSLSDTLKSFDISCLTIGIDLLKLSQIPLPAIGYFKTGKEGLFVIFDKIEENQVTYTDEYRNEKTISFSKLKDIWNGIILLVEANKELEEIDYVQKRKEEQIKKTVFWGSIISMLILGLFFMFLLSFKVNILYSFKVIGLLLSYLLLQKQFGNSNTFLDNICENSKKSSCKSVLNSEGGKLFGIYHLSEIACAYFCAGIISIWLSINDNYNLSNHLLIAGVACGFSLYTIYYQSNVIKKWCPLCLLLTTFLWIEFVVNLFLIDTFRFSFDKGSIGIIISFLITFVLWLHTRDSMLKSKEIPSLKRKLNHFKKSESVFHSLLSNQPKVLDEKLPYEFEKGSNDALLTLIMVSDPMCKYCIEMHRVIEDLWQKNKTNIKIIFRFSVNANKTDSVSYRFLEHLIKLQIYNPNKESLHALKDWFLLKNHKDARHWKEKYPITHNYNNENINSILKKHRTWFTKSSIKHSPTIVLNGKIIPKEFSIQDISYHLNNILTANQYISATGSTSCQTSYESMSVIS